jgi:hypothetical protein
MRIVLTPQVLGVERDSVSQDACELQSVPSHKLLWCERIPIGWHFCDFVAVGQQLVRAPILPIFPWPLLPLGTVTTQDFIKFWGKFFVFILLVLIENSQGFKTFWVYLKALFENYLKSPIIFLKNFFEKDQVSKYYFPSFIQTLFSFMQTCLQKIVLQNLLYSLWVAFSIHNWLCFLIIIL